jgi:hypothetical protein
MKNTIDFAEIEDWRRFEDLVAEYFRQNNAKRVATFLLCERVFACV